MCILNYVTSPPFSSGVVSMKFQKRVMLVEASLYFVRENYWVKTLMYDLCVVVYVCRKVLDWGEALDSLAKSSSVVIVSSSLNKGSGDLSNRRKELTICDKFDTVVKRGLNNLQI